MDEGTQTKRETTAREWLVLIAVGVVLAVVGPAAGYPVTLGLGVLLVVVAAFGLAWRLLGNR